MSKYMAGWILLIFVSAISATAQNQARFSDIRAGMKDRKLELQALKVANERATDLHWLAEYKKATIISEKWQPILNNNGYLIGRKIHMELYCVEHNGNCEMADFTFKQKYNAEGYTNRLICIKVGELYSVDCE